MSTTDTSPIVTTDLLDYAPGATTTITASGFIIGSTIEFEVEHVTDAGDDGVYGTLDDVVANDAGEGHEPWYVTDGGEGDLDGEANGVIVTTRYVNPDDSLGATFLLTANAVDPGNDGLAGTIDDQYILGQSAAASFTDAPPSSASPRTRRRTSRSSARTGPLPRSLPSARASRSRRASR